MNRGMAIVGAVLIAALQACSSLGPDALKQHRPAYNDAITATNSEQNLAWIVRMRYGLPHSQLAVSNITANVRFRTNAELQLGFGPSENYLGNLIPFGGGVVYDENPTISYVPVQGEKHLRSLLSPLSMDLLGLLLNMNYRPETIFAVLVRRVNGVPNPDFITDRAQETDTRFTRLLASLSLLATADKLTFFESNEKPKTVSLSASATGDKLTVFESKKKPKRYSVWIHDYSPDHTDVVAELLDLLGIEGIEPDGQDIVLRVVAALRRPTSEAIAIQTRSVLDMARIASASVEVPEEDRAAGLTVELPKLGLAGRHIRVQRAVSRPATAAAATRFNGSWYYIAGNDIRSKLYFRLVTTLMSVQLSKATAGARAPVLTVPVN